MSEYAVFILKEDKVWLQATVPLLSYTDAQDVAKLMRKAFVFAKKTRVRRLPPIAIPELSNENTTCTSDER